MPESIYINAASYRNILQDHGLQYTEKDVWLDVGRHKTTDGWIVFISVVKAQIVDLFQELLPVLVELKMSFRVISDSMTHHYLNMGRYGRSSVGRVFTLYPITEQQLVKLIAILLPLLRKYSGPRVEGTYSLAPSLYAAFYNITTDSNGLKRRNLDRRHKLPVFTGLKEVKRHRNDSWLIGGCYFRLKTVKRSPKGNIYKAISLKGLKCERCIIKQGRLNMVDDYSGRTIRDRLLWQKKVLTDLLGKVPVPVVLDFFDKNGDCYLVMRFIDGIPLDKWVRNIYKQAVWGNLTVPVKLGLLTYYLKALCIIEKLHASGYIHRDIKHGNLMIAADGSPVLLDFELAWSIREQQPEPAFIAMDAGYKPPEQLSNGFPTINEDIYALGGLLLYLLTGRHPGELLAVNVSMLEQKGIDKHLVDIILNCREENPMLRPSVSKIIERIKAFIQSDLQSDKLCYPDIK